jgi:prephenate dehydrogenase
MFGPKAEVLSGRNILICETGDAASTEAVEALFRQSTARLVRVPLERHDEWMAQILGLSHLTSLCFADTLLGSGFAFSELSAMGSTTFNAQSGVTSSVVNENPDLYFEIQAENRFTPGLLQRMERSLGEYREAVLGRNREAFKRKMEASRGYFAGRRNEP